MPPTLRDIASELNLSVGTVSKVLNQRPDINVPDETRRRIIDTARILGYRPHAAARALRSGKTGLVALALNRSTPIYGISEELAKCLSQHGYDLLVKVYPDHAELLTGLDEISRSRSCDAVLLWGREVEVEEAGLLLKDRAVPFALKGRLESRHPDWPQVDFDHEGIMREIVSELAEQGHRKIAYFGYDAEEAFRYCLSRGFREAVEELTGHPPAPHLMAETPSSAAPCEQRMEEWLSLPEEERPTALAIGAGNDAWIGAEMALIKQGIKIGEGPGEFPVIGTSDNNFSLLFGSARSYKEIEMHRLARSLCNELLIPLLTGKTVEETVIRVQPRLRPLPSRRLLDKGLFLAQR